MPPAVIARLEHELDRVLERSPFCYAVEPLACEQVGGILQGDQPLPVGERDRAGEPARVVDAVVGPSVPSLARRDPGRAERSWTPLA